MRYVVELAVFERADFDAWLAQQLQNALSEQSRLGGTSVAEPW